MRPTWEFLSSKFVMLFFFTLHHYINNAVLFRRGKELVAGLIRKLTQIS